MAISKIMNINRKPFFILWIGCIFGYLAAVPFGFELQQEIYSKVDTPLHLIIISQLATTVVLYGLLIFVGLSMLPKTPFSFAIIRNLERGDLKKNIVYAVISGLLAFTAIFLVTYLPNYLYEGMQNSLVISTASVWKGFLASFYGAINEEVLLRLFVMTSIAYGLLKISWLTKETIQPYIVWFSIVVSSLIFGLGHVPAALGAGFSLDARLFFSIFLPYTVGGLFFGHIFWKKGFEYAVISHFVVDIMLNCVVPLSA